MPADVSEIEQLQERLRSANELLASVQRQLDATGLVKLGERYVETVLPRLIAEFQRLREVEAAALNLDAHRNSGYASVVSYLIRLHEALWGEALKAPDWEPDHHPET